VGTGRRRGKPGEWPLRGVREAGDGQERAYEPDHSPPWCSPIRVSRPYNKHSCI
jgi:hypothetical protein